LVFWKGISRIYSFLWHINWSPHIIRKKIPPYTSSTILGFFQSVNFFKKNHFSQVFLFLFLQTHEFVCREMRDVCVVGIHSIKFCLTKTPQHFRTVKRTKEKNKKSNDKSDSIAVKRIIIILRPYVEYFTVKKFPSFSVFNFRKKNKKNHYLYLFL
jgi:hypothetical protein